MCGRFSLAIEDRHVLAARFHADANSVDFHARYNIAPTQSVLTVAHLKGQRRLVPMKWGLIPHWNKTKKSSYQLVNVRSESLIEKPYFRHYAEKQRCVIPADGFFEWKKAGAKKIPFRATLTKSPLFAFAGLWDAVSQPDGSKTLCFTILTTEANELLASVHDRMPVILKPDAEEKWLDPSIQSAETLFPLLKPYPAKQMELYEVSPLVNSWKNEGPACINPV